LNSTARRGKDTYVAFKQGERTKKERQGQVRNSPQVRNPFAPLPNGQPNPVASVLEQEVLLHSTLRQEIVESLGHLRAALEGREVMQATSLDVLSCLRRNQVRCCVHDFRRRISLRYCKFLRIARCFLE
jgi:hypothetical protein